MITININIYTTATNHDSQPSHLSSTRGTTLDVNDSICWRISPSNLTVQVQEAHIETRESGSHFYQYPNKQIVLTPEQVDETIVKAGAEGYVAACHPYDPPSGFSGSFALYDITNSSRILIGHASWDMPWGSDPDYGFKIENDNYVVGPNPSSPNVTKTPDKDFSVDLQIAFKPRKA